MEKYSDLTGETPHDWMLKSENQTKKQFLPSRDQTLQLEIEAVPQVVEDVN